MPKKHPKSIILFLVLWPSLFFSLPAAIADQQAFQAWVPQFKQEALQAGFSSTLVDQAFAGASYLPKVIKADRNQPEFMRTTDAYLQNMMTSSRVKKARRLLRENRKLLKQISHRYRVPAHYLVALWGIESSFGRHTGKIPLFSALGTLAYDGRRSEYFKSELFEALKILETGMLPMEKLRGSWAGAMGQMQFMPSSFNRFAVDADKNGQIDLWQSKEDFLASGANYLAKSGWQRRWTWGREVKVTATLDASLVGLQHQASLKKWQALGIRKTNETALPKSNLSASLIQPDGPKGRSYLVYDNFRVIMKWNRSKSFALAVGLLADRIKQ